MTADPQRWQAQRLERWGQTSATRIADPEAARPLVERVGIATLFPASPELPNLFHAYTGDPNARTESAWDSPAGQVYGWRWALGRTEAAFYTAIVRSRPTWVSWTLLPAVLRLRGELRTPDELYDAGELSEPAYRIAQALEAAGGVLTTGELRQHAGFPTGKAERAAYLKAVEALDTRLMLAKVFALDDKRPHKGGPLSQGIVHGHAVTCPLHNKVVDLDGGEAQAPDSGCIRRRPAKLEAGRVPLALPA